MSDSVTSTTAVSGLMKRGHNLFRFPHTDFRLRVECRPVGEPDAPPVFMTSVSEREFDELDVTLSGQPERYCILAPGLAVVWPTAYHDYTITLHGGAS